MIVVVPVMVIVVIVIVVVPTFRVACSGKAPVETRVSHNWMIMACSGETPVEPPRTPCSPRNAAPAMCSAFAVLSAKTFFYKMTNFLHDQRAPNTEAHWGKNLLPSPRRIPHDPPRR